MIDGLFTYLLPSKNSAAGAMVELIKSFQPYNGNGLTMFDNLKKKLLELDWDIGVDTVGDDGKTLLHHVAAKVRFDEQLFCSACRY